MTNLRKLNKKELVNLFNECNLEVAYPVFDYHCFTKQELIDAIVGSVNEAKMAVMESLGRDFNKAVSFWKQLKGITFMKPQDYVEMEESWKTLQALVNTDDEELSISIVNGDLLGTARQLRDMFAPNTDVDSYSHEELVSFIESSLEQFNLAVNTERLVKDSTTMVKMSMDNVTVTEDGALFNTSEAMVLTGQKVDYEQKDSLMRVVDSSEDGISRILQKKGLSSVSIFLGNVSNKEDEMKALNDKKRYILRNGITDIASGKHYVFGFQSASATRKANFIFVEGKDWNDTLQLWYDISGTKDWDGFSKVFLKDEKDDKGQVVRKGVCIFSKVKSWLSNRGANSYSMSKISPKWAAEIAKARIDYTGDCKMEINRPFYRRNEETGKFEYIENELRILTPGDGQMIGSFSFHALVAVSMRIISETDYYDFVRLWEAVGKDASKVKIGSRLYKIINKIPNVFQIRHEGKKGICVRYNLEAIEATKDIELVVPESARKFIAGEWSEFPLEVCNFLKKKKPWVNLNAQFISALQHEKPFELKPIADYWLNYAKESVTDIAKAQQFHGLAKSSDDEEAMTVGSNLVAALRTSSDLVNESQICNWRKEQYKKFLNNMRIGRIMVPGTYTYMVCDPAWLVQETYGVEIPTHLKSNEYYYEGKTCQAGLFRSPLIHPSEAQKVQLVANNAYWYMKGVIVFNCYDCAWDRMGGADFDGDTCAVVPDDNEFGDIIVRGIKDYGYDIVIPSNTAKKEVFDKDNLDNFIEFLVGIAQRDMTGKITNEANTALDISNHLRNLVTYAKETYHVDKIYFSHPRCFNNLGHNFQIQDGVKLASGENTIIARGFAQAKIDFAGNVTFTDEKIVGEMTLEQVEAYSMYYLMLAAYGKVNVGREIDKAKTGKPLSKKEYTEEMQLKYMPTHAKIRKNLQGRPISDNNLVNEYRSLSTLGRLCDYIGDFDEPGTKANEIAELLNNGTDKMFLLHSLLRKEEADFFKMSWSMSDGTTATLQDMMTARKKVYNKDLKGLLENLEDEERTVAVRNRKEKEIEEIRALGNMLGASMEVMAVAAYIAAYDKDTKQNQGLTYGWLLIDELLSVFSRNNKKFELFRLPKKLDNDSEISIRNGFMFINERKYMPVRAEDAIRVAVQAINGNNYALIRKPVSDVQEQRSEDVVYGSTVYSIGVLGFKYHILSDNPKNVWKEIMKSHDFIADIVMDATGRVVLSVDGCSVCALMRNTNFELLNKKIKFVNSWGTKKETEAAITGLNCVIIGEADK